MPNSDCLVTRIAYLRIFSMDLCVFVCTLVIFNWWKCMPFFWPMVKRMWTQPGSDATLLKYFETDKRQFKLKGKEHAEIMINIFSTSPLLLIKQQRIPQLGVTVSVIQCDASKTPPHDKCTISTIMKIDSVFEWATGTLYHYFTVCCNVAIFGTQWWGNNYGSLNACFQSYLHEE